VNAINSPVVCTDLDCVFTVRMIETQLLYLVSWRGHERNIPLEG